MALPLVVPAVEVVKAMVLERPVLLDKDTPEEMVQKVVTTEEAVEVPVEPVQIVFEAWD
jgi:hypothetical protein